MPNQMAEAFSRRSYRQTRRWSRSEEQVLSDSVRYLEGHQRSHGSAPPRKSSKPGTALSGTDSRHIAIPGPGRPEVFGMVGSSPRTITWRHYSEYPQVRLAKPCVRGALKHAHSCFFFLQEVAGVSFKHTDEALNVVTREEIMVSALPGRPPRQAPRYPRVLVAALEDLIMDLEARMCWKVRAWWLLAQAWGTLRYDDHWGILPADSVKSIKTQ